MKEFFSKKHTLRTAFILLIFAVPLVLLTVNSRFLQSNLNPSESTQSTSASSVQQPFQVVETFPTNGEKDVYPGEITISFTTDKEIVSPESFTLTMLPTPPHKWNLINSFPTRKVEAQIYGSLQPNTQYTLTLKEKDQTLHTWSFTTSNETPDSSSQMVRDTEEEQIRKFYPLFHYIPYSNDRFSIDYTGELTLSVQVTSDTPVEAIKQEVADWIMSHGIDPTTHKINYIISEE